MNQMYQSIIILLFIIASCTFINGQAQTGQTFTATYNVAVEGSHIIEKDRSGSIVKAINYVPGIGQHSILGDVTTLSIVRVDISSGENVIEFVETDQEGNSLFVTTKGITTDVTSWECYGAIMGGTGIYQTATGYYHAIGSSIDTSSSWTADGMLYYSSVEDEKAAIRQVIIDETDAYVKADNARGRELRSYPHVNIVNMPQDQAVLTRVNNDNEDVYGSQPFNLENIVRSDWDIQVRHHIAWATFRQTTDAIGSNVPTIETRILEKEGGKWKIAHVQTTLDYANAYPPLQGPMTSQPEVYSIHEIELRPDVDPLEFESFFNNTIAPIYNKMKGQRIMLTKSDRGQRTSKYSAIVIFDSVEDRNRIFPVADSDDYDGEVEWGPQSNWLKLASMMSTNIGVLYSDYIKIDGN